MKNLTNIKLNIIIADDDLSGLKSTVNLMKKLNYITIDCASNGQELIEKCKQNKYDLIITDIVMPQINGLDAIENIKKLQPDVKVIISSAYDEKEYFFKSIHLGVDKFLGKPYDIAMLFDIVSNFYESKIEDLKSQRLDKSYKELIKLSNIGTLSYYSESNSIESNENLQNLFGIQVFKLEDIFEIIEQNQVDELKEIFFTGVKKDFKIIVKLKNQNKYIQIIGFVKINLKTNKYTVYSMFEDVSELVLNKIEIEDQKTKLELSYKSTLMKNHQLQKAKDELKKQQELTLKKFRSETINELIRVLAHEWRQPLALISVIVQDLMISKKLDTLSNEKFFEELETVKNTTEELSNTLMNFTENMDTDNLVKSKINLIEVFKSVKEIISNRLKDNNINFTISSKHKDNVFVDAYSFDLQSVFLGLLINNIDAIETTKPLNPIINIQIESFDDFIEVNIIDNAGGIDENIMDKVFDPYFSTKTQKSGKGLGLYFVKQILEYKHNSSIELKNENNGLKTIIKFYKDID